MLKEFREFLNRGSVIDLAVGVVIGTAFGKIVASLVDNLVSPLLGFVLNGVQLNDALPLTLKDEVKAADGSVLEPALVMKFGAFMQSVIDFVAISFVIFLMVKAFNKMKRKQEAAPAEPPAPPAQEVLLREIRDLLKK
ncbi:MAG: large-conductance mechanosensitive channel protein MscL [Crocinitomicaceae bacterium]|nr:large-conductance mechanosensitive channel protein MscL [Crocinitomicaceae bacterium]